MRKSYRDKMFSFLCITSNIGQNSVRRNLLRSTVNTRTDPDQQIERHKDIGFDCRYCHLMFSCRMVPSTSGVFFGSESNTRPICFLIHQNGRMSCCSRGCRTILPIGSRSTICSDKRGVCLFCRRNAFRDCQCNCVYKTTNAIQPDVENVAKFPYLSLAKYPLYSSSVKRATTFETLSMKRISRYHEDLVRIFVMVHLAYDSRVFTVRCTACAFAPSRYDVAMLFPTTSKLKSLFNMSDMLWLYHCQSDTEYDDFGLSVNYEEKKEDASITTVTTVLARMGIEHQHCKESEIADGLAKMTDWHEEVQSACPSALQARRLISAQQQTLQRPGSVSHSASRRSKNIIDYLFARETARLREGVY